MTGSCVSSFLGSSNKVADKTGSFILWFLRFSWSFSSVVNSGLLRELSLWLFSSSPSWLLNLSSLEIPFVIKGEETKSCTEGGTEVEVSLRVSRSFRLSEKLGEDCKDEGEGGSVGDVMTASDDSWGDLVPSICPELLLVLLSSSLASLESRLTDDVTDVVEVTVRGEGSDASWLSWLKDLLGDRSSLKDMLAKIKV